MPLRTQTIDNLYGGVSQQAAINRSSNQLEAAVNAVFSVAEGADKRPPLEVVTTLTSSAPGDSFIGWVRHDSGEWVVLVLPGDGSYRGYRVETGGQLTVVGDDTGLAYLTCDGPAVDSFRMAQANDRVFIVNKELTVTLTSDNTAGSLAGSAPNLQDDSLDNPAEGAIYKIHGTAENPFDDYFAKYSSGLWVEWVEPGIPFRLDNTTMPHEIEVILNPENPELFELEFKTVTWGEREVGSPKSNKAPSFVGKQINGISFVSDRLTLLAERSIVMSEVGEYENFWRTTVTDVLDSDRIDVSLKHQDVTQADWIETASGEYVVFAGGRQFVLEGRPALTPSNISIRPATRYPSSAKVAPQAAGANIYFASDAGQHTHVREMFLQEDAVTLNATNVASHAFAYIPKNPIAMEVHPDYQHLLMATAEDRANLYSYQFMWLGDQKVMSAWNRWELAEDAKIYSLKVIDQYVYAVYELRNGDILLGRFNLKPGDYAPGFTHKINLDHLELLNPDYNSTEDRTYFTVRTPVITEPLHEPAAPGTSPSNQWITLSVVSHPEDPVTGIQGDGRFALLLNGELDDISAPLDIQFNRVGTGESFTRTIDLIQSGGNSPDGIRFTPDGNEPAWFFDVGEAKTAELIGYQDPNANVGDPAMIDEQNLRFSGVSRIVRGEGWDDKGTSIRLNDVVGFSISSGTNDLTFSLPGNWSGGDLWYGIEYEQRLRFSEQFFRPNGGSTTYAQVRLRNMTVHCTETPYFRVRTLHRGRDSDTISVIPTTAAAYTARTLNDDYFRLNVPVGYSGSFRFPVLAEAADAVIELLNESYFPARFQAAEWKALISTRRGR